MEVDSANNDEEGGDNGDKGELGLEPVDGEEVEEQDGVGDHPGHLDVEEAGLLLYPGLLICTLSFSFGETSSWFKYFPTQAILSRQGTSRKMVMLIRKAMPKK